MLSSTRTMIVVCTAAMSGPLSSTTASPANLFFARDMPISRMNAEDVSILQAAIFETLDTAKDGQSRHWENPKTGAHGDLTPRASFTDSGMPCRDLGIDNSAGGLTNRSVYTLCKGPEGWKVRPN